MAEIITPDEDWATGPEAFEHEPNSDYAAFDAGKVERAEMVLNFYGDSPAKLLADLHEYARANRLHGIVEGIATFATTPR